MSSIRRIVPEWKYVLSELHNAVKEREEDVTEHYQEDTVYIDAAPTIQFYYSCGSNYIRCLTTFSGQSGTTVVGFQWGHKMVQHQIKVWTENLRGKLGHYGSFPLENDYKVEHLIYVPNQRAFVGACSDLSLRVFSEPAHGMSLQHRAVLLSSVFCMHYCKETEELLTGGMGSITFWAFWPSLDVLLGITHTLDWTCSSLRRDTVIGALVADWHTSVLYAVCGRSMKRFDLRSKEELRAFRGRGRATLRQVSPDWVRRYLYTGDSSGHVQVWSCDTRCLLQEFRAHTRPVLAVALQQSTHTLLTSSADGWVREWNSCGELLLELFVDEPGGVRHMQPIGKNRVLLHSFSAFSVWRLQDVYQPFHEGGCSGRLLQRVECGKCRARLLSVSEDAVARLISPVSGETLLLSWPYQLLERAMAFAYNPRREELFVASGSPEVLVLDTSLSPCPAKRILCTSTIQDQSESVTALEAVLMGGTDWLNADPPPCLVFSGHHGGKLQLLSPHGFNCQVPKAHAGAVLEISSLPGWKPQLCCYGEDKQLTVWVVEVGVDETQLTLVSRITCCSNITLTRLMPGLIFGLSPNYSLLLYSLLDEKCLIVERTPSTTISCMDYCASLGLVTVSGPTGIVEVWDTRGTLLAEIRLGAPVSQVCFANVRGDILASFSGVVSIIAGVRYLPIRLLKQVLDQAPADDLLEDPILFLPRSPSCYDLGLVPRMSPKPAEETPEPEISPAVCTLVWEPDVDMHKASSDRDVPPKGEQQDIYTSPVLKAETDGEITTRREPEPGNVDQNRRETPGQTLDVKSVTLRWPVAPDGFVPNSVIRNWLQNQKPGETEDTSEVETLQDVYRHFESERIHEYVGISAKVQVCRVAKPVTALKLSGKLDFFSEPGKEEEDVFDSQKNLLKVIAQSQWLAEKPKVIKLESVMHTLILTMECMDAGVYDNCTEAVHSICKIYDISLEMKQTLTSALLRNVQKGNPHWKRLRALNTLLQLDVLGEGGMLPIVETLTDQAQDLRQVARDIVVHAYSIEHKEALMSHLCNTEHTPARQKLLQHLEKQLTEDLQLKQDEVPSESLKSTQSLTRPCSPCSSAVDNGSSMDVIHQYDDFADQTREMISELPVLKSHGPALLVPRPDETKSVSSFTEHVKPPHRTRKKDNKLSISLPKKEVVQSVLEEKHKGMIDPATFFLYKKLKTCLPLPPTLPALRPGDSGFSSCLRLPHTLSVLHPEGSCSSCNSTHTASLVELPPVTKPEHFHSEPIRDQGDPNWRESLYQLTSLYGFRSQKGRKLAAQGSLDRLLPAKHSTPSTLPPVQSSQLSLGQRVVEKIQMRETGPLRFHHVVPLPWQLNIHTLDHTGESQYGRLHVDWRAGCLDSPKGKLPPIRSKIAPSLLPQGGSVS